jgi:hypothetical protein
MACTWRPLVEKFSVGREREREEEMRKQQRGMTRALSIITTGWGRRCKQPDVPPMGEHQLIYTS